MVKVSDIPKNKGQKVSIKGEGVALYNDSGTIKAFSTVCPHLGCDVNWSDSENTWDCPCHGSRFEANGALKKGPARRGLDSIEVVVEGEEIKLKK